MTGRPVAWPAVEVDMPEHAAGYHTDDAWRHRVASALHPCGSCTGKWTVALDQPGGQSHASSSTQDMSGCIE